MSTKEQEEQKEETERGRRRSWRDVWTEYLEFEIPFVARGRGDKESSREMYTRDLGKDQGAYGPTAFALDFWSALLARYPLCLFEALIAFWDFGSVECTNVMCWLSKQSIR